MISRRNASAKSAVQVADAATQVGRHQRLRSIIYIRFLRQLGAFFWRLSLEGVMPDLLQVLALHSRPSPSVAVEEGEVWLSTLIRRGIQRMVCHARSLWNLFTDLLPLMQGALMLLVL